MSLEPNKTQANEIDTFEIISTLKRYSEYGDLDLCVESSNIKLETDDLIRYMLVQLEKNEDLEKNPALSYILSRKILNKLSEMGIGHEDEKNKAYFIAATSCERLNRIADAEKYYLEGLERKPHDIDLLQNYAILLHKMKRIIEAKGRFTKALALAETDYYIKEDSFKLKKGRLYTNYAFFLIEIGDLRNAKEQIRNAEDYVPDNPHLAGATGDLYLKEGNSSEAKKYYLKALESKGKINYDSASEIHTNLGAIYAREGKIDEARKEFIMAKEMDESNLVAARNLHSLSEKSDVQGLHIMQKIVALFLLFGLMVSFYLFYIKEDFSQEIFAAQSLFLIGLIVFILFFGSIQKFKVGPEGIELEKLLK